MKRYEFKVTIAGCGESLEEAWANAIEAFDQDPGIPPDKYEVTKEEEDEEV